MIAPDLPSEQTTALRHLLSSYRDIFELDDRPLGQTSVVTHRINTGDASPIHRRLYRVSATEGAIIQKEVDRIMDKVIIECSISPNKGNLLFMILRSHRDAVNPVEVYSEEEFAFRFRFTKASMLTITQLKDNTDQRGAPFPPLLKLLITLRFYGTGAIQTVVGDLGHVSQQYVSRCVWEITQAICVRLFPKYVRLPTAAEAQGVIARFYEIGRFPGVTRCIDCTNIPIVSPGGENAEVLRNRKGFFSINVQAITGPELQFFVLVASWPGSVHDSRIFADSRVMALYEQRAVPSVLLVDQGYACLPFLMTPLRDPRTGPEKRYNSNHIRTRNSVERAFGVWKRRFACLRVNLLTKTERSAAIITARAALHNIACMLRDPCPPPNEEHLGMSLPDSTTQGDPDTLLGTQARSCYIRRCFSYGHRNDEVDLI
ncbi:putative nuclease HARBI1 [Dermacentor albipictus]|uniref:putative nuclease HARBI1 n=1 Tax=Dermacentor albipictus TaxID=60249 RepID=UPI0038FCEED1